MPLLRIVPYREIAREVATRLAAGRDGSDPLTPWAEEVIVPSRGVAEAVTAELLARMPNGVAAVRLQTLEELAQRLLAGAGQTPRVASEIERRLAMRTAIRSVDHPMMESRGVAAMLERAYRDVRDSGLTLAELSRRAGRRPKMSLTAILRAWTEYERLIAQLKAIDAADRLAGATHLAGPATPPQLIAGFYDMTGAQLQLAEALLRAGAVAGIWIPTDAPFAQPFLRRMQSICGASGSATTSSATTTNSTTTSSATTTNSATTSSATTTNPATTSGAVAASATDLEGGRNSMGPSPGDGVGGRSGHRSTGDGLTARDGMTARDEMAARDGVAARDGLTARDGMTARDEMAARDGLTARDGMTARDEMAARDGLAARDEMAARDARQDESTTRDARQYDTRLDELQGVCASVAALLAAGTPASEIGIVARSLEPYDVRLLNRFAGEHGFRTTLSGEVPLAAHRIGRAALTLLRLRDRGFPRSEVLELVRDGLHTKTRLDVDATDMATRRARIAGGTSAELLAIPNRRREVDDYLALVSELEALTAVLDIDLLARLGSLFRIDTEADLAAAETLDGIAAVFRRTAVWNRGLEVAAVLDAIEQESLPSRAAGDDRPVVWAGEVLRFRGRSFRHLFAVRMEDDVFPQRRTEDPLLPDSDRRALGVREIGDGREEEALLFSLLSDSAAHVHYSFAAGDGFGKVLRPSRLVRGIPAPALPAAAALRAPHAEPGRQLQLLTLAGTRSPFDGYIGPLPRMPESFTPTQLEDFGECPQKFLFKHLLGVTDIDHPERELQINVRDKGIFDHRILERFYRETAEEDLARAAASLPTLPDDLTARLEALIEEEFEALERKVPPFNRTVREIERRATKRILREFLVHDLADLHAQELLPRWFEYRFGRKHREEADHPEPFLVNAGGLQVRVEGTIDRIDTGAAMDAVQRYRIVDYKSGKALRHINLGEKVDRGVRLQLALYAMAVAEFFGADPGQVSATIKPIVAGEAKLEKFAFALHEKRDALLETLEIFVRAIVRGEFPAFPNDGDDINSCKYCPVNHSCRTRHDQEARYALQQQKDPRTLLGGAS